MSKTSDMYIQTQTAESKYYPFFGDSSFSGKYLELSDHEVLYGIVRMMEASCEREEEMLEKYRQQTLQHVVDLKDPTTTDKRLAESTLNVHQVTESRITVTKLGIARLKGFVAKDQLKEIQEELAKKRAERDEGGDSGGGDEPPKGMSGNQYPPDDECSKVSTAKPSSRSSTDKNIDKRSKRNKSADKNEGGDRSA